MDDTTKKIALIVAEANHNEAFRKKLLKEPHKILQAQGISIPNDATIDLSFNPEYGVFLALDIRQMDKQEKELSQGPANLPTDHPFNDCLY